MRRFLAVATTAVLLVVAGCKPEPPRLAPTPHQVAFFTDDAGYYGSGPRVAVVGDSITNSTHDRLHDALPFRGLRTSSMAGEGWTGGTWSLILGATEPILVDRARTLAATNPEVAVLALGTNDAWQEFLAPFDPLPILDSVVDLFGSACTVGVLVAEVTTAEHYDAARSAAINARLRERVDVIVDWRLTATPDQIDADGIHLSATGMAPYTAAVAAGVEDCMEIRYPPSTTSTSTSTTTTTEPEATTTTTEPEVTTTTEPEATTTTTGSGTTTTVPEPPPAVAAALPGGP